MIRYRTSLSAAFFIAIFAGLGHTPAQSQTIVTVPPSNQPAPRHHPSLKQSPEQPAATTHKKALTDQDILSQSKHPSKRLRYTNRSYRHQVIPPHQPEQSSPVPEQTNASHR